MIVRLKHLFNLPQVHLHMITLIFILLFHHFLSLNIMSIFEDFVQVTLWRSAHFSGFSDFLQIIIAYVTFMWRIKLIILCIWKRVNIKCISCCYQGIISLYHKVWHTYFTSENKRIWQQKSNTGFGIQNFL